MTKSGVLRFIKYIMYLGILFILIVIAFIAVCGQVNTVTYNEDALIILGAGIRGENVTLPLMYRLNRGIEYYNKNPNAVIVVSGGQGAEEDITEALAMEKYLISCGVPKEKILKEEKATSTYENFAFSKLILDNYFKKSYKTAFITNDFHVFRAYETSKFVGIKSTHLNAKIKWYLLPITYLREFLAVMKFYIFTR